VSGVEEFGFDKFAADLDRAGKNIGPEVKKTMSKTLLEMKKQAQKIVRGHPTIKHLASSFNYDVQMAQGFLVVGEVGADHAKKQGTLDHVIENGTLENAPIPHWRPAAEKQVPLWEKYLEQAAVEALGDR
jgi:hypothetical protein